MGRSRASAKAAGTRFESLVAGYLAGRVDDRIERRRLEGSKDRGDIAAVRTRHNERVVLECKDYGGRTEIGSWLKELQEEKTNDGASIGAIVAKRRGTTAPEDQIVIMTLADLAFLLGGE